ncbi:hypothetical protein SEMRO_290_G109360.1 [Seminavis robusta]|uniref:Uncharacterized protein n=1 Tax=Seminavis robusta TaxID=568900 RepID=A0A9N8HC81_9STRA|nr:hypothetical protein SEMRO_290_G109360.1 [Seminavis robusta]|eukprot:Sro290_g109360.1 n/a (117) ;mRNA; r:50385-50735
MAEEAIVKFYTKVAHLLIGFVRNVISQIFLKAFLLLLPHPRLVVDGLAGVLWLYWSLHKAGPKTLPEVTERRDKTPKLKASSLVEGPTTVDDEEGVNQGLPAAEWTSPYVMYPTRI